MRLLRDDNRHDQIHDGDSAKACEEREDDQQTDDGWVDAKVFAQARADACDHAVGRTACQLPVVGVHDALLSMISTGTYAGRQWKLQKFGVRQLTCPVGAVENYGSKLPDSKL